MGLRWSPRYEICQKPHAVAGKASIDRLVARHHRRERRSDSVSCLMTCNSSSMAFNSGLEDGLWSAAPATLRSGSVEFRHRQWRKVVGS